MAQSLAHRLRIEAHAVWRAVRDPRTPVLARVLGVVIAAYALSPIDLIPDFVPVLGLVDDAILIPAGIWLFERMIPGDQMAEHRATATQAAEHPVSLWGVIIVLALWALAAWAIWAAVAIWFD